MHEARQMGVIMLGESGMCLLNYSAIQISESEVTDLSIKLEDERAPIPGEQGDEICHIHHR